MTPKSNSEIRKLVVDARDARRIGPSANTFDMLCEVIENLLDRTEKLEQQQCWAPVNSFGSGTAADNDPTTGAVYDGEGHGVREAPMLRPR